MLSRLLCLIISLIFMSSARAEAINISDIVKHKRRNNMHRLLISGRAKQPRRLQTANQE